MISPRAAAWPAFAWLAAMTALAAGCAPPPPPTAQSRATQATIAACRQRADEIYAQQNRGSLFLGTNDRDAPESASFQSGITTRGLASRFGWDSQVADCVRNQGSSESGETGASSAPGPATGAAPAGGPPR